MLHLRFKPVKGCRFVEDQPVWLIYFPVSSVSMPEPARFHKALTQFKDAKDCFSRIDGVQVAANRKDLMWAPMELPTVYDPEDPEKGLRTFVIRDPQGELLCWGKDKRALWLEAIRQVMRMTIPPIYQYVNEEDFLYHGEIVTLMQQGYTITVGKG